MREGQPLIDDLAITLRAGLSFRDAPGGPDLRPLQGTPEQIVADIRRYRELGVSSFLSKPAIATSTTWFDLRALRARNPAPGRRHLREILT